MSSSAVTDQVAAASSSSTPSPAYPPPSLPLSCFHVGQRVQVDDPRGPKASVRFIGPLHTHSASLPFVGLQWDDAGRGKHDGTHAGRVYFTAPPGSASFVRHERLLPGRDFAAAVRDRYAASASAEEGAGGEEKEDHRLYLSAVNEEGRGAVRRRRAFDVEVQFVGAAAASHRIAQQLGLRQDVSLLEAQVSHAGDASAISALVPCLTEVDLSHNLLVDWTEAAAIVRALPRLRELRLSHNALQPLPSPPPPAVSAFSCLRTLVLNAVPSAWHCVLTLASHQLLPALAELHLAHNGLSSLSPSTASCPSASAESKDETPPPVPSPSLNLCFPSLTTLDLSHNLLSDWSELCRLSELPRLQQLQLSHNAISSVAYPPRSPSATTPFASLSSLSLSDNALQSLSVLSSLSLFPALTSLSIQRNAALDAAVSHSASTLRFHAISRIPALQQLNSSSIPPRERSDADKFFLTFALQQWRDSGAANSGGSVSDMFPRYRDIAAKYGIATGAEAEASSSSEAAKAAAAARTAGTLASQTVEVELRLYGDAGEVAASVKRRLLLSMKVSAVRMMAERLFKGNAAFRPRFVMKARQHESEQWELLDDALRPVSHYASVADGSCVAIMHPT